MIASVSTTFQALADPVRATIVEQLADGDLTVGELAAKFAISFQAVSRHIQILEAAGLVSKRIEGKTRPVHLESESLTAATDWLDDRRQRLEQRYARLDKVLDAMQRNSIDETGTTMTQREKP